jgi:transketolase
METKDKETRLDSRSIYLRKLVLRAAKATGKAHIGGAFSVMEILRVLYDSVLRYNIEDPFNDIRDRLILSKGHSCFALYAILADKGFFDLELLDSCMKKGSSLGGHPEYRKEPGLEVTTGSLGHGLSMGVGMAIASKIRQVKNAIWVILGDGELQEGSIWEAAMSASKHQLSNLNVIIDYNKIQSSGRVEDIQGPEFLFNKFESFGFEVYALNGHDITVLENNFSLDSDSSKESKPRAFICHTIKGKGILAAESNPDWHYKRFEKEELLNINSFLGKE